MEQFVWTQSLRNRQEELDNFMKEKDRIRHAEYYKKNRRKICSKQRRYNSLADRTGYSKKYWDENKEELKHKHRETYQDKREERLDYARRYYEEHKEEIKAKRRLKREREKEHEL